MAGWIRILRYAAVLVALFAVADMALSLSDFDLSAMAFFAWNVAPCGLVYMAVSRQSTGLAAIGFAVGTLGLTLATHLLWMFDIAGFQTGSSTSGLIFIFIPVYAVGAGILGALVGLGASELR